MTTLRWRCLSCGRQTVPMPVPFDHHEVPPSELYCTLCGTMTTHAPQIIESNQNSLFVA